MNLPKIYPITDRNISGLSHAEQVRRLIAGGATLIQLREKSEDIPSWYGDAAEAVEVCRENGVRVIINDRADIALALGADGVHAGQTDMPPDKLRELLGGEAVIGISTHTLDQVREAVRCGIDYIGFGPVFATKTKADPDPVAGPDKLRDAVSAADPMPVVAIGGIDETNLQEVFAAGASSSAIISNILRDPDNISSAYRALAAISAKHR